MRRAALIDVDVLVALVWPTHEFHQVARRWFADRSADGWATTPITQAGLVRLSVNRAVTAAAASPVAALGLLKAMTARPGHAFWPDDLDGVTSEAIDTAALTGYRQITDAHLVSLAHRRGGCLATFDAKITSLVRVGFDDLVEVVRQGARTAVRG